MNLEQASVSYKKIREEMQELGTELHTEMQELATELRTEMQELGRKLREEIASTAENVIEKLSSQIQDLATYVDETCATKKELQALDNKVDVVIQKQDLLFAHVAEGIAANKRQDTEIQFLLSRIQVT